MPQPYSQVRIARPGASKESSAKLYFPKTAMDSHFVQSFKLWLSQLMKAAFCGLTEGSELVAVLDTERTVFYRSASLHLPMSRDASGAEKLIMMASASSVQDGKVLL